MLRLSNFYNSLGVKLLAEWCSAWTYCVTNEVLVQLWSRWSQQFTETWLELEALATSGESVTSGNWTWDLSSDVSVLTSYVFSNIQTRNLVQMYFCFSYVQHNYQGMFHLRNISCLPSIIFLLYSHSHLQGIYLIIIYGLLISKYCEEMWAIKLIFH